MRRIQIKRKEWIRGSLLLAAGILFGALVFSSSGNNQQKATQQQTTGNTSHAHDHDSVTAGRQKQTTWTCSMHPQVRQDEPGQCPICGMDLIPAEESEQSQDPAELKMTEEALKLAEIQTSHVEKKQPTREIRMTGKVQVDQRKIYVQPSHIPGRIEHLSVQFEGEYVKKGQPIARVYSPDLISAQEELLEALETKKSNPQLVEAAREKLRKWKFTSQQIANIEQEGTVQEHMTIQADVGGIVHKQMVREGDYVKKGTRLFHIAQIDRVWVMFDAYQEDVPFVQEGDRIEFNVSSIPGKTFSSRVTFVDPVMDEQSRVAKIRTEASNVNGMLKPGMFAKGVLKSARTDQGKELILPKSAVMWTGERSVVYVRKQNQEKPVFLMRQVVLGPSLGDSYIIKEGLREGEQVVTNGTFAIDAAAQLADKPSMMNQEKKQTTASSDIPDKTLLWPDEESETYQTLVSEYLTLKDQLVGDQKTAESANNLLETIQSVNMKAFSQQAHMKWMDIRETLTVKSKAISQSEKLEEQRRHFIDLSNAMISLVKTFSSPENRLFVQFCPMADSNQGAFWLSAQEQIRNPYFGDRMLTCGEVREQIDPNTHNKEK